MESMNDKLETSFITLTANLTRLSTTETLVVQGMLKELENEITGALQKNPDMTSWRKARYNALLSQTRATIKANYGKISEHSANALQTVAEVSTKATDKIFKGVGISLQSVVTTPEQWKALSTRSLIEGAPSAAWWAKQSQSLQDAFVREMRMGYAQGESIDQLVQRVRGKATGKRNVYWVNGKKKVFVEYKGGIMDIDTRHAMALVRTSIMQVAADAKMEMFKANSDIIKGVVWNSVLDSRTTPQCVLGTERVTPLAPIEKIFRAYYAGEIFIVETASGKKVCGTPNHPILTQEGWMPLKLLNPSKHIVYSILQNTVNSAKEKYIGMETTFAELFDSFGKESGVDVSRTNASPIDFYGDGEFCEGEICIKSSNSFLRDGSDTSFAKQFVKDLLVGSHLPGFFSRKALLELLSGIGMPASGTSAFKSSVIDGLADKSLVSLEQSTNIGETHTTGVKFDDSLAVSLFGNAMAPTGDVFHDTGFDEQAGYSCGCGPVLPPDGNSGNSILVKPDNIVSIRRKFWRGHVYTLQNVLGLYSVSGLVVKNCRARSGLMYTLDGKPIGHNVPFLGGVPLHWGCRSTLLPVTKSFEELEATPGITKDYLDSIGEGTRASMTGEVPEEYTFDTWFRTLPEADQKSMLGPAKYRIWKEAGLTFQEMVDQRGNPLTVEQLAKAYGFKIEQSRLSGIPNIPKKLVSAVIVEQRAQALASEMARKEAEAIIEQRDKDDQARWDAMKSEVAAKLADDKLDISANEKELALQKSENAPDGNKMTAYEHELASLRTDNATIRDTLKDLRETVSGFREHELAWRNELRKAGKEIPYWDMRKYLQMLNLYIIKKGDKTGKKS